MSSERHQSMYKLGGTPPGKDAFRAKCFERMKSRRSLLVDKFRGFYSDDTGNNDAMDSEVEEFLSTMEEIKKELQEEEQRILEEYCKDNAFEGDEDQVICPMCKKDVLHQNPSVIFCACGLSINVQQDGLTLSQLKSELTRALDEHEPCPHPPAFSLVTVQLRSHLTMLCQACDFMYFVI